MARIRRCPLLIAGLAGIATSITADAQATTAPVVQGIGTQPTSQGGASRAIVVFSDGRPLIVGTAELAGLELYDSSGKRTGAVEAGEAVGVDVRYDALSLGGSLSSIVVAADSRSDSLRFYRPAGGALTEVTASPTALGIALEGACLYKSAEDGSLYAFALGDGGEVDQYLLFEKESGRVGSRLVRRLHVPSTVEQCTVDDRAGALYVVEETVGLWRLNAEPETDVGATLIDAVRLGRITEEAGGIALYDGGPSAQWLVASNSSDGQLLVYDRSKDDAFVGAISVQAGLTPIEAPGGLYATSARMPGFPHGAFLIADEDAPGGSNYKIVSAEAVTSALNLSAGTPQPLSLATSPAFPVIKPVVETEPVAQAGDAADDPAIWANPTDPAASLVIGTDKQGGLHVYDMEGKSIQFAADGKMNNVDLREGFKLAGSSVVLVTASDRAHKSVAIYMLDTAARRLVNVSEGIQATGLSDPYGLCMSRSPKTGRYYVYVSDPDGLVRQWELVATKTGKVRIKQVRDVKFGSQTEGCVVDDSAGLLYVAEEDVGLWSLPADPVRGAVPQAVDKVATNSKVKDDMEGVGLYDLGGGRGYLVVSSQGNNSYAVYRREGDRAYLGSFMVVADPAKGIDGISETDGLEVSSANLGPGFEHGAMIAQDGRNVLPVETQNFKMVPWTEIAKALNLEMR